MELCFIYLQLTIIPCNEPGVVHFKVDSLQCRVGLNLQYMQSLHLKVTPLPDHKDQWSAEELQVVSYLWDWLKVYLFIMDLLPLCITLNNCYM